MSFHKTFQLLLWIGSDPFLTVLLFDWLASNVIEGDGAKSISDSKPSTATPFNTWETCTRFLVLKPHAMYEWEANIPTQTKIKNPLKHEKLMFETKLQKLVSLKQMKKRKKVTNLFFYCSWHDNIYSMGFGNVKAKSIRSLEQYVGKL